MHPLEPRGAAAHDIDDFSPLLLFFFSISLSILKLNIQFSSPPLKFPNVYKIPPPLSSSPLTLALTLTLIPQILYKNADARGVFTKTLDHTTLSYPHFRNCEAATSPAAAVTQMTTSQDDLKRIAAHRAVELVESGMVLGLGTGSTAIHALERIADLLRSGELTGIVGIPTSKKTEGEARALGIPLADLESNPNIDLSIDGADEVDPFLNLVKGRGGSLLREKMIEGASKRFVVIVDESKWVERLGGSKMAVPVEVIPFGWKYTLMRLKKMFEGKVGFDARLRMKGEEIFLTDNLNYIIDLFFENGIEGDLNGISDEILRIVGVVEHGMFLWMATEVIIAGKDGVVVKTRGEVDAAAEQRRRREVGNAIILLNA